MSSFNNARGFRKLRRRRGLGLRFWTHRANGPSKNGWFCSKTFIQSRQRGGTEYRRQNEFRSQEEPNRNRKSPNTEACLLSIILAGFGNFAGGGGLGFGLCGETAPAVCWQKRSNGWFWSKTFIQRAAGTEYRRAERMLKSKGIQSQQKSG